MSKMMQSFRQWSSQKAKLDTFPFAKLFTAGMVASGFIVYFGGKAYARREHEKFRKRVDEYERMALNNRKMAEGGVNADLLQQGEESTSEPSGSVMFEQINPLEETVADKYKGPLIGTIVAGSIGTMLYKNWDRKSVAMSLMHTRVMAQGLVVFGILGMAARAQYMRDQKAKSQASQIGA